MRPCKVCKHRVHAGCAVPVPYHIAVVCKHCIPKSPVKVPPAKKKFTRRFKPAWQVGRPWFMPANGVMWCLACRAHPQLGMQKAWQTGTRTLRRRAVLEHSKSGLHAVALALWQSVGTSSTVIGRLLEQVRNAIFGLFMLVYHIVKRMAPFENLAGDAEVATMVGGTVAPAYRTWQQVVPIMHAIAAPIRAAEGHILKDVSFFALASAAPPTAGHIRPSLSTLAQCAMGKAVPHSWGSRSCRPVLHSQSLGHTSRSSCGPACQWSIGSVLFWYCADGASVMQSDENRVAGLLMKL